MSFDVHLIPSEQTDDLWSAARIEKALASVGASLIEGGDTLLSRDGVEAEWYGQGDPGAMAALRSFSPGTAEALFAVADATACFLMADEPALRTPSNHSSFPEDAVAFIDVKSAVEAAEHLFGPYETWSNYRDQVVQTPPPTPPPAPPSPKPGLFSRLLGKRT